MKRFKIFSAVLSACLCIIILLNTVVCAEGIITYSHNFYREKPNIIGWKDFPITVYDSGIFNDINGNAVSFGGHSIDSDAADGFRPDYASYDVSEYPVFISRFTYGDLECTVMQFADEVSVDGISVVCVYSSLSAVNNGKEDAPFCPTDGMLIPLSDIPETVIAGSDARCDYVTPVFCSGELPAPERFTAAGSFDDRKAHMMSFWSEYIDLHCSVISEAVNYEYRTNVIKDAISGTASPLSVYDGRIESISEDMTPFAVWLMSQRGALPAGYTEAYDLQTKIEKICSGIHRYDCDYADDIFLYSENDSTPTAESCLGALTELGACIELMPLFGIADDGACKGSYQKLMLGTETVFLHTIGTFDGAWEMRDLQESGDDLIFPLNHLTSPEALCSWYVRNSAMGRFESGRLRYLAREALKFASFSDSYDTEYFALATVHPSADGGVCIGRGINANAVSMGISVTGFSTGGGRVQAEIYDDGNDVIINIDSADDTKITVAIPFFRENIENATCAFEEDRGVLTPEAGCKSIKVTLKRSVTELIEDYAARSVLEAALIEAEDKSTDGCTDISKREFEAALSSTVSARNAGIPAAQMTEAASELSRCSANLSKIISGYTYSADGEILGYISDEIMQKFTLPKSGTVTEITVGGTYGENTTAKIYAVADDGYSMDGELISEVTAEKADGGMRFKPDFEAESGKSYVMVLTPGDSAEAAVTQANDLGLYTVKDGAVRIYSKASLSIEINVVQADRTELDAFYETCLGSDVSRYTRESVKNLQNAMRTAADLLRTPDAEAHECEDALWNLKLSFSSLTTYASDMRVSAASPVLYILIGVTIVLLLGSLATASVSGHRRKDQDDN